MEQQKVHLTLSQLSELSWNIHKYSMSWVLLMSIKLKVMEYIIGNPSSLSLSDDKVFLRMYT